MAHQKPSASTWLQFLMSAGSMDPGRDQVMAQAFEILPPTGQTGIAFLTQGFKLRLTPTVENIWKTNQQLETHACSHGPSTLQIKI